MNQTTEQAVSLTEALNSNSIPLSAVAAGKVLRSSGMIENRWRESSKPGRPPKQYRAATPLGEQHGIVNETSTLPTGDPVLVKYLPSMFSVLWAHPDVQATLAAMLSEGEVSMRSATAKHSEAF